MSRHPTKVLLVVAMLLGVVRLAAAADYPERPINIVVPFPPAGASDVLARLIGEKLSAEVGQPVTVENRAGAGTVIGTTYVARAEPDGYTLLLTNNGLAVNATLSKALTYDTRALSAVAYIGDQANVLVVNNGVPAGTLDEFIALARANPGKIAVASGGNGGSSHLALELFKMRAGVNLLHTPYRGGAPALTDVIGGQVQGYFDTVSSSAPYVKDGKVRALGVTTRERSFLLPDVPSLMEAGVPDYDASNWNAVFAPPGTPGHIVDLLNTKINRILAMPEIQERLKSYGITPRPEKPEYLVTFLDSEIKRWAAVIEAGKIESY
ncbi:Bug family tripartite tricarboxylate transporter substrate binding protein [Verticiella sediminum]|nr:tripartite tricarboxylate transporter substrate binding protein [Verticiella sediminum]